MFARRWWEESPESQEESPVRHDEHEATALNATADDPDTEPVEYGDSRNQVDVQEQEYETGMAAPIAPPTDHGQAGEERSEAPTYSAEAVDADTEGADGTGPGAVAAQMAALMETVAALERQVRRLAREQFRANEIHNHALEQARQALEQAVGRLYGGYPGRERALPPAPEPMPPAPRPVLAEQGMQSPTLRLLESLMPVVDAIEAALQSGQEQIAHLQDAIARHVLQGWLQGQHLLRERLLALLDRSGVRPIEALGMAFDPYRHVAVEAAYDPTLAVGTVVAERRRGYAIADRVLRYAEVVVVTNPPGAMPPAP